MPNFAQNQHSMKKVLLSAVLLAGILYSQAQQLATPQSSPTQTIKQNFGVGSIELSYSRPGLKGRKVGTDLAPYGQVWRTGANSATTILFSEDVTIGGTSIKAGKYGLLSIPGAGEWTLIITKDLTINQPALYKQENDIVRVKAPVKKLAEKAETFTINFCNFTTSSCILQMSWENSAVELPISTNTDEKVMKQINDVFIKESKPYYAAASYYYDNGKDLSKAKEWIDKASADPANARAAHVFMLKTRIYQKLGDKAGAKASAEKTLALATEAKNEEYIKTIQQILATL
ncbi:hypothetical protein GCM10011379_21310 [Filimonas zeae]|uniref:DUF2911 domain-containing protein n=2 Tax=Filimonas zeae TaxID=1737353 RepID=A0A917IXB8_9BACT|nr:hypothetical protein GCM10011379_21310 [Filimonas zeae]